MAVSPERLSRAIGQIYGAIGAPDGFLHALRQVRTLVGASSGMLFTPLLDVSEGGFGFVDHVNPEFFSLYRAHFWDKDPWAREGQRKGLVCSCRTSTDEDLLSQAELQKEEIYPDLLAPMDTTRLCCSVLAVDDDPLVPRTYLSLFRGLRSRPFSEDERQTLAMLGPHVLQALRLAHQTQFAVTESADLRAVLHDLSRGIVLLDADKQVVFANRTAERLCAADLGILLLREPKSGRCRLRGATAYQDVQLQKMLDASLRQAASIELSAGPVVPSLALTGIRSGRLIVTAAPMRREIPAGGKHGRGQSTSAVIVYLEDVSPKHHGTDRLYVDLFGLTPAEARLARALATGEEPKTFAARQNVSENTVRTHIRSLLHKTGTPRLAALVALLNRIGETQAAVRT